MANPNKNPDYRAKLPMQSHDLSHKFAFTASTGMILPVAFDFVQAGEKLKGKVASYIQLKTPLQKNAKFDMEQIVDYFFVPMPMLYQPFESMVFQTDDFQSSAIGFGTQSSFGLGGQYSSFPLLDLIPSAGLRDRQPYFSESRWCEDFQVTLRTGLGGDTRTYFLPEDKGKSMARLFEMLGLNSVAPFLQWPTLNDGTGTVYNTCGTGYMPKFFPWQLLAYHAIYEYYYRIDMFERFDQRLFNWDRYFGQSAVTPTRDGSGASTINITGDMAQFFLLHYRPRYLDYFTNLTPTPYVQMTSYVDPVRSASELVKFKDWLSNNSDIYPADSHLSTVGQDNSLDTTQLYDDFSSYNSTSGLRNLFAADRFLQIQSRAANRFDDQVLAHLGYKVPHDPKHNLMYLGTDRQSFNLQTLEASATTEQMNMGEKMGQLTSTMDAKGFQFTAPTYGVFMACMSIIVKPRYYVQNERHNFINSIHDLWFKEYDNLGKQPQFLYEVENLSGHRYLAGELKEEQSDIYGWQYRYTEKKRRFDKVSTAFARFAAYDIENQFTDGEFDYMKFDRSDLFENPLSSYFSIRVPHQPFVDSQGSMVNWYSNTGAVNPNRHHIQLEDIIESPTSLNGLLGVDYDLEFYSSEYRHNPASLYDTDPFIIDCDITLKKLSPMSVYSMPELDKF